MGLESWTAECFHDCPAGAIMPLASVFSAFGDDVVIKDGVRSTAVGELVFSAAPAVMSREAGTPFGPPRDRGSLTLAFWQPFTMEGRVAGYASRDLTGEPLFNMEFTGSGMARLLVDTESSDTFSFSSLDYFFTPATPVPEAGTLVLLSAGAALLCRRRRLRSAEHP